MATREVYELASKARSALQTAEECEQGGRIDDMGDYAQLSQAYTALALLEYETSKPLSQRG